MDIEWTRYRLMDQTCSGLWNHDNDTAGRVGLAHLAAGELHVAFSETSRGCVEPGRDAISEALGAMPIR